MKKALLKKVRLLLMVGFMFVFTLDVSASGLKEMEDNDTRNDAMIIETDTTYEGVLNRSDDIDWYKFTTDKDYFTLTFDVGSNNASEIGDGWDVAVCDVNGNELKIYGDVEADFVSAILPFSGTYLIRVEATGYDRPIDCRYDFTVNTVSDDSWESEENGTTGLANPIETDSMYHGALQKRTDVDYYQFTNDKDYFTLTFDVGSNNASEIEDGWDVAVCDVNGKELKSYEDVKTSFTSTILPFKGTYLIRVEATGYDRPIDCRYDFTVNTVTDASWEKELNDAPASATKISTDHTYYGALYSSTDVDYYIFDNDEEQCTLTFDMSSADFNELGYGYDVQILDSKNNQLHSYTRKTTTFTTSKLSLSGKYLIRVEATGYNKPVDCKYSITVKSIDTREDETYYKKPYRVSADLYGYDDIKVQWEKVIGAKGYYVYYKKANAKNYTFLKKTSGNFVKKANLADGCKYNFKVVAYKVAKGQEVMSSKAAYSSVTTLKKISTPTLSKKNDKVQVKWENIAGETGYQISKAKKSSGTDIVSTYRTTLGNKKLVKAEKGKTFYYKVRAYKVVNNKKVYGPWSNVKSYKLK